MELSIEQLADLKIAIEKNARILKENESKSNELISTNTHLVSENIRLKSEITQQVEIKENLIKENNEIRKEKDLINWEYEKRSNENYLKIKKAQDELESKTPVIELRLLEADKRERDIVWKIEENEKLIKEIRVIKQEIWEEKLYIEKQIKEIQSEREKSITETERKLKAIQELEEKWIEIDRRNTELNKRLEDNTKQLNEINAKYIEIQAQQRYFESVLPKIENFKIFLKEVKAYVTENGKIERFQLEKLEEINNIVENKVIASENLSNDITKGNEEKTSENERKEVDLDSFSVAELKQLLNEAKIEYNPNNNNKASLIKLLTSLWKQETI